jgi:hypothetical protein
VSPDDVEAFGDRAGLPQGRGQRDKVGAGPSGTARVDQHGALGLARGGQAQERGVRRLALRIVVVERHLDRGALEPQLLTER